MIFCKKARKNAFQQIFKAQWQQLVWPAESHSCKTVILIHDETFCHGSESLSPRLLPPLLANSVLTRGGRLARGAEWNRCHYARFCRLANHRHHLGVLIAINPLL